MTTHKKKCSGLFFLLCFLSTGLFACSDTTLVAASKTAYWVGGGLVYAGGLVGLNELWYKGTPRRSFHFFDDSRQWAQMDKAGHAYSGFYLSVLAHQGFQKMGFKAQKSLLWGSITGFALVSTIEVFDGFSARYGASLSDLAANGVGAGFYFAQQTLWGEIRLQPKFSFQRTPFPELRPQTFGKTLWEQILKDYNGQTYWLALDWGKFFKEKKTLFPKFITVAWGYGAGEMLYGSPEQNRAAGYQRIRKYFLGIDIQLSQIPTERKWLKTVFGVLSVWRIPAPALEYSGGRWRGHWLKY